MKNTNNAGTRLEAVRPGDMLTLQRNSFRVLTSQRDNDLVTLELDDAPGQPMTLIGLPSTAVNIESHHDGDGQTPANPAAGEAHVEGQNTL